MSSLISLSQLTGSSESAAAVSHMLAIPSNVVSSISRAYRSGRIQGDISYHFLSDVSSNFDFYSFSISTSGDRALCMIEFHFTILNDISYMKFSTLVMHIYDIY